MEKTRELYINICIYISTHTKQSREACLKETCLNACVQSSRFFGMFDVYISNGEKVEDSCELDYLALETCRM